MFDRLVPNRVYRLALLAVLGGAVVVGIVLLVFASTAHPPRPTSQSSSTGYFSPDYFAARSRFRQRARDANARLDSLAIDARGPRGEALTIDVAWFGAHQPRRVLLHSSGLHGVEGFAGSAIQLQFLEAVKAGADDLAIVVVHTLNPYGMAWLRRVNEENVDLNRNFLNPGEEYAGAADYYRMLNPILNPSSPPGWDVLFYPRAIWIFGRYGSDAVRQAVAGGQYEYARGVFYGGKRLQDGPLRYGTYLRQHLQAAEAVVAIDVHTGLGEYGKDVLLAEKVHYETLRRAFGERVALLDAAQSPAFRIRGGYPTMLAGVVPHAEVRFVFQEFGTYKLLRVMRALIEENRWHHYGDGSIDHPAKHELRAVFDPDDEPWRQAILARGGELLRQAVELLSEPRR